MRMVVLIFLYYFITANSYILNATLINATDGPKATIKRRCVIPEPELKDLLKSECFVDKSLIIKDFLNMKSHITCVTAPRRFGKTWNLKMLKTFLQLENGQISSNLTEGCKLFITHNLNIYTSNNTFFHLHCGKYPVIYIDFKTITGSRHTDNLELFAEVIRNSLLEHTYLLDSTRLARWEKNSFSNYISPTSFSLNLYNKKRQRLLIDKGLYLSQMLNYHFSKKPIVLIDGLDTPLWKLLSKEFPLLDTHETIYCIGNFISNLLENNRHVERGLITSCSSLSRVILQSSNSIVHFPFLENHPLVKYYGLTENEVREKLNYFNILQNHEDVKYYYNGYKVQGSGDNVYNTWSIMNYLQTEHLDDYWIATAGLHNFSGMFAKRNVRKLVLQLLCRKNITIHDHKVIKIPNILILRQKMTNNLDPTSMETEIFFLLLCDTGYFNPTRTNTSLVSLEIANHEIYQHLHKQYVAYKTTDIVSFRL